MSRNKHFRFVVVGAGPSGILALSRLLSEPSISPETILWVDPYFQVGDFGRHWSQVSSNTKVKLFIRFLERCFSYDEKFFQKTFSLFSLEQEKTCDLHFVVSPLQWITQAIQKVVVSRFATVENFQRETETEWKISLSNGEAIIANNLILAPGAESKRLSRKKLKIIPLEVALNQEKLLDYCGVQNNIAVFGSSHSAVLVMKNLIEMKRCKKIINFFKSPLRYAIYLEDKILFDNTGLKGVAEEFARMYLENPSENILRLSATTENEMQHLPSCDYVVYAVGFHQRKIKTSHVDVAHYDKNTGILMPGLYGLGIAYPSEIVNHLGEVEQHVGLWKFANHLEKIFSIWLQTFR